MKTIVSGVILIDKPQGLTSQQTVFKVKQLFKSTQFDSKKAGHTGTLDPMATGLLPVCLGEATKFSQYALNAHKSYEALIRLGQQTDTGDQDGKVIASCTVGDIQSQLAHAATHFLGKQWQTPPMYSALKKDGKKLYELARLGVQVWRDKRPIYIDQLSLTALDSQTLKLAATVSKGTYIRVLAEDIAQFLGTVGHLIALRRTKTAHFDIQDAITLEQLEYLTFEERHNQLKGIDECVKFLPQLILDSHQTTRIKHGQRLNVKQQASDQKLFEWLLFDEPEICQPIRLFGDDGCFVGVGLLFANGRLQPSKLVNDAHQLVG